VHSALIAAGLQVWFDAKELRGEIVVKMAEGVEASDVIVVFITKRYCIKVSGRGANCFDDNCRFEWNVAMQKKASPAWWPS
jgi:hypothetical protein